MKTKIFTFFFGVFLLGITFFVPLLTFATPGTVCKYDEDPKSYWEGKCNKDDISCSKPKKRSTDCSSGEKCCGAIFVVAVPSPPCDYTFNGKPYTGGSCVIQSACSTGTPSGSSSVCEKRICCGGKEATPPPSTPPSNGLVPCGDSGEPECTLCFIFTGIQNIINWGMMILTTTAFVILVAMAIVYIVSAGNSSVMETAKTGIKNTLIGFGIVLLSWVIINAVILLLPINTGFVTGNWWTINC